jgi:ABC-type Zn2+ transport system substrate-binding protein/surface adhesin
MDNFNFREYMPQYVSSNIMYCVGKIRYFVHQYVNVDSNVNHIFNNIYVGDVATATNKKDLDELGITHIVSVLNGAQEVFPDIKYKVIHIDDDHWVDIKDYFNDTNQFIDDAFNSNQENNKEEEQDHDEDHDKDHDKDHKNNNTLSERS